MFPIKVLVVLSVCNLHFRIVCGVGFLGSFFGDHTAASWSWNLCAVSQAVPHKKTTGDHNWLWKSHCGKRAWGYKLCPLLVLMLGAAAVHGLVCSVLLERGFGRDSPWQPCLCGRIPWERVSCSVQLPSSHKSPCPEVQLMSMSHQISSLWVFHVWTLVVALLSTALRLSDPSVALRVGYFKLISRLPP